MRKLQRLLEGEEERRKAGKMKIVLCPICGQIQKTNKPNKKYCCFACKEAGQKIVRSKWEARNAGYMTDYMKTYREEKRKEKAKNGN